MFRDEEYLNIQGLTLLETMMALALGALVILGIVMYYGTVSYGSNVNKAVADMNAIVGAYRDYATAYPVTTDTTIQVLQDNDLLPSSLIDPWGQAYTTTVSESVPTTVTINLIGLAKNTDKQCQAIKQAVQPAGSPAGSGCSFMYTL